MGTLDIKFVLALQNVAHSINYDLTAHSLCKTGPIKWSKDFH